MNNNDIIQNPVSLANYGLPKNIEELLDDYFNRHNLFVLNYMVCIGVVIFLGIGAFFYYCKGQSLFSSIIFSFFVSLIGISILELLFSPVFEGLWKIFHKRDNNLVAAYDRYKEDVQQFQKDLLENGIRGSVVTISDNELSHWIVYTSAKGRIFHRNMNCIMRVRTIELGEAVRKHSSPCSRCVRKSDLEYGYYLKYRN